jgi:hypothetical protein
MANGNPQMNGEKGGGHRHGIFGMDKQESLVLFFVKNLSKFWEEICLQFSVGLNGRWKSNWKMSNWEENEKMVDFFLLPKSNFYPAVNFTKWQRHIQTNTLEGNGH